MINEEVSKPYSSLRRQEIRWMNQKLADRRKTIRNSIQKNGMQLIRGVKLMSQFKHHLRKKLRRNKERLDK